MDERRDGMAREGQHGECSWREIEGTRAYCRDSDGYVLQAEESFWLRWVELKRAGLLRAESVPDSWGDVRLYV